MINPIFQLIQHQGNVDQEEMYRVFNMGVGMVVICSPESTGSLMEQLPGAKVIGEVVRQAGEARVVVD